MIFTSFEHTIGHAPPMRSWDVHVYAADLAYHFAHRCAANHAKEYYRLVSKGARPDYLRMIDAWNLLRTHHYNLEDTSSELATFCREAARLNFVLEHDYKENAKFPSWCASPQPGPVYFMPSRICFVHAIICPSLGTSSGESRFGRNVVYTRDECVTESRVKISKYSDDTL